MLTITNQLTVKKKEFTILTEIPRSVPVELALYNLAFRLSSKVRTSMYTKDVNSELEALILIHNQRMFTGNLIKAL